MIGYILTIEQRNEIQWQYYAPYQIFNCIQDINNVWFTFLTINDKKLVFESKYDWLLSCPQGEYIAPLSPPFS